MFTQSLLGLASVAHPIVICLDAFERLFVDEHKNGGSWLPAPLPRYCKAWTNELYRHRTRMSAFLKNLPVNGICVIVFTRFYRLEIHSLIGWYFRPACELLPLWTKKLYSCTVTPLSSL